MSEGGQPWWHEVSASRSHSGSGDPSAIGTAAQEASRLAAAVSEWAARSGLSDTIRTIADQAADGVRAAAMARTRTATDTDSYAAEEAAEQPAGTENTEAAAAAHAHELKTCDFCPVCQGINLLRTVSPEAAAGTADALRAVTDVIRQAIDTVAPPPSSSPTRVERINIE